MMWYTTTRANAHAELSVSANTPQIYVFIRIAKKIEVLYAVNNGIEIGKTGSSIINIILVMTHPVLRHTLKVYLETDKELHVVGEAADGLAGVTMAAELKPTVVITDVSLPKLRGLEMVRQIHKAAPDMWLIVYSINDPAVYAAEAYKSGASRYVSKAAPLSDLVNAIHQAN